MLIQEPFALGNSPLHRVDPRLKVVMAGLYSVVVAVGGPFSALLCALIASVVLVWLARLSLPMVAKRLLWVNSFILVLWVIVPLTFDGRPAFETGGFEVSYPGIVRCAQITVKSNAIVLVLMSSVATMTIATLGHTLNRLRAPEKIVYLLLMTYRYVFVIEEEYLRSARALKIRGFRPRTDLSTYRTYAYVLGMIFVRAAARAERVLQAMQCRGFKGRFYSLRSFVSTPWNWAFGLFMATTIIIVVYLNVKELIN